MQKKRSIVALFTAFCVLFSVAVFGAVAHAEGDNTLTVGVAEAEYKEDIVAAQNLVVDVYKVASAEHDGTYDTYNYTLEEPFTSLQADFDAAQQGTGDWAKLYADAAKLSASATAVQTAAPITGDAASPLYLDDGMYLVLARGENEEVGSLKANGALHEYQFQASMVAMPTKWADEAGDMSGTIRTDGSYGEWHNEATINLKATQRPLYGDLVIKKLFEGPTPTESTTFVFRATGTSPDGSETYDLYGSVMLPGESSTTLTHIMVGTELTVSEVYTGARYQLVSANGVSAKIVADKDAPATVEFTNAPDGDNTPGGHGIRNHFDLDPNTGNWPNTATPGDAEHYTGPQSASE